MRLFVLLPLLALAGCSDRKAESKKYSQIQKMTWLVGRWEITVPLEEVVVQEPDRIVEEWALENDSVLVATSWVYPGKDSVLGERMRLEEKNGRLNFVATVPGQNSGQLVIFKDSSNTATFINAEHDFPQRIHYRPVTRDSALAEIGGRTAQGYIRRHFIMKRINSR